MDLLDQDLRQLEWVPLEFRYRFRCNVSDCTGHDMAFRDREAGESYRKYLRQYEQQGVEEKLRERWFTWMFAPDHVVHCFVGNLAKQPRTFMLLASSIRGATSSRTTRKSCSRCKQPAQHVSKVLS
ncbi:hypothetical protein [Streptomyces pinistramenti]|uniref:hypothetical protein n=1 Tax=Streptomyces pinistramenti TaxID=2884812 RepID=UPI001D092046|nr:hypothetical protein [Streptomyces pinistramenti]MCB5906494.1 hypothetical protein [Streptomyces pinistramenti]